MGEAKRRGAQQRPPRILLGYVHGGNVRHEFLRSLLETINGVGWEISILDVESGPLLSRARNTMFEAFQDSDADYLLSVDTDIAWHPSDVRALLELAKEGKPIVAGHYWGYAGGSGRFSTVGNQDSDGSMRTLLEIPRDGYAPVDFVGMGFTLISRAVLEGLGVDKPQLWPFAEAVIDGQARGEDITFCMRAKEAGFQSWVSFDVNVGHVKSVVIGGM